MTQIDVILPLAIRDVYTYTVPADIACPERGMRVVVPLGKKRVTGVVLGEHTEPMDSSIRLRDIDHVLDSAPVVTGLQLSLWRWMAGYYMCSLGEVMAAALPSGLIDDDYRSRQVSYIRLAEGVQLEEACRRLTRAPKQQELLHIYGQLAAAQGVERRVLLETSGQAPAVLRALIDRGLLEETRHDVSRLAPYTGVLESLHPLSEAQSKALSEIEDHWQQGRQNVLLHGVTSSGKTEVYMHLIEKELEQGRQVLYLVPEIALTTQLTDRLRLIFGDKLLVYHSRFSNDERVEIYHAVGRSEQHGQLIVGARSAVFLPYQRLSMVIVDEEHEPSYKQADPAPRYHARAVALMMARMAQQQGTSCRVLLGSATPSVESYYLARQGVYGLVSMTQRYAGLSLPRVTLIDLQRQYHRREMYGHFADPMVHRIREVLQAGKQVILFQNRRGYAPMMQCMQCGEVPHCVQCDVSMVVHRLTGEMRCHCCGYHTPMPSLCPKCGGALRMQGFGTERLEDEIQGLFPEARVLRMDLDTTRSKHAYQDIINRFANHECDILIGTQMVTKGLHFDDVQLVGVLDADQMVNQPDFRAYERTYQMLEQVAGRAGRKGQQGEVMIQSRQVQNRVLNHLLAHDYESMYGEQVAERELFHYPPFYRLIRMTLRHRDSARVAATALALQQRLQLVFGERQSAVIEPSVSRQQGYHVRELMLRIEQHADVAKAKRMLQEQIDQVLQMPDCKGTTIVPDIDPM